MTTLGFCSSSAAPSEIHRMRATTSLIDCSATSVQTDHEKFFVVAQNSAREGNLVVAFNGMPRFKDAPVDATRLLALIRDYGSPSIERLTGTFAIVIHDVAKSTTVLAVDRMGIERMTYCVSSLGLCFGTRATWVRKMSDLPSPVRNQGIYDYLFFHMLPSPDTIFDDISKLPPAHLLEWANGKITCKQYWNPAFHTRSHYQFRELKSELDVLLENAVRSTLPNWQSGAFLSGGIDSSTVAGYLKRVVGDQIDTFSIGFGVEAFDELKYAQISASHFNCRYHEYNVTAEDIVSVFRQIAEAYDEPFGNSSVIPTYYCARLAADSGINHLLAGDGGDELFGGNERYARQKAFELYGFVPSWMRSGFVEPISRRFSAERSLLPLRKLRRYVEQARVPLPDRLGSNFAFSVGLRNMLSSDFADSIDTDAPLKHMRRVYRIAETDSVLDRLLAYDWRLTLADNDLRKVGTMCELVGVKVSYPLLDNELVDFSTRIPASRKMRGFELRSFFKRAMRGFLPVEVLTKSKHGFGLPFGVWLKTDNQLGDLIYSNLTDMDSRRIFKPGFIDDVIERHKSGPASYFGNFIWDLAMLEEWLKIHA